MRYIRSVHTDSIMGMYVRVCCWHFNVKLQENWQGTASVNKYMGADILEWDVTVVQGPATRWRHLSSTAWPR